MAVKQSIPNSTNPSKSLTFSKLRGVDYSSSPFEVDYSRAVNMKNMINEDGVNHKRQGWTSDVKINHNWYEQKIYDICEFCNKYIVAWSTIENEIKISVWNGDEQLSETSYILNLYFNSKDEIPYNIFHKINKTTLFVNSSNYMIGYDKKTGEFSLNQDYYVPTTSISINSDDEQGSVSAYEEPNMFTSKRINSLIGKDVEMVKVTFKTASNLYLMNTKVGDIMFLGREDSQPKEVSFRVVPGTYVISSALSDGDGYDLLYNEDSSGLVGEATNVSPNERRVTINEDIIINVVEG